MLRRRNEEPLVTLGRGAAARAVVTAAHVMADDTVVDIGCRSGTAVRAAARVGAWAVGIDPDPRMLRRARWISELQGQHGVEWMEGCAEHLPLPDDVATIAWTVDTLHEWGHVDIGLRETHRVLRPGGRFVIVERLTSDGAGGSPRPGLSRSRADELADHMAATGYTGLHVEVEDSGRPLIMVHGKRV